MSDKITNHDDAADFNEDKQRGQMGEDAFLNEFVGIVEVWPENDGDFIFGDTKIEVKTEYKTTERLFMERYSNDDKNILTPGGPWQAWEKHDCPIYISCYNQWKKLYFFRSKELCDFVDNNRHLSIHGEEGYRKKNKGYHSWGHAMPIYVLEPICIATWKLGQKNNFEMEKRKFWDKLVESLDVLV